MGDKQPELENERPESEALSEADEIPGNGGCTDASIALAEWQLDYLEHWLTESMAKALFEAHEQGKTLGKSLHQMLEENNERAVPIYVLCSGIKQTATSLLKVHFAGDADSCYVLGRTLVERVINFAFLTVCDQSHFADWVSYSRQKAVRLTDRTINAGTFGMRLSRNTEIDPSQTPGLEEDIAKYTGRSGRENTHWTKLSLSDRIGALEGKCAHANSLIYELMSAMTTLYELGAEAQHGTLLGAGIQNGVLQFQTAEKHLGSISFSVNLCLDVALHSLAHFADMPEMLKEPTERMEKRLLFLARRFRGKARSGFSATIFRQ